MEKRSKIHEKQSRARRIKILLKRYEEKFLKEHQQMANFKEPVIFLLRPKVRKCEFYEDATAGWFQFVHSDGSQRRIKLSPEFLTTFDYGKNTFKGYLLDEDHPTPLPEKPVVTAEQFQWAIDKTQQDLLNHKAKEYSAKGEMWYKIAVGVAIIIGVVIVGKLLVPNLFQFGGKEVVQTVVQNTSAVARDVAILP